MPFLLRCIDKSLVGTHGQLYRGTSRSFPWYCDFLDVAHPVNKAFLDFVERGGELGMLDDPVAAQMCAATYNSFFGVHLLEVVLAEICIAPVPTEPSFLGYDVSDGYNNSYIRDFCCIGCTTPEPLAGFCAEMNRHLLFNDYHVACRFLEDIEKYCSDREVGEYSVVAIWHEASSSG